MRRRIWRLRVWPACQRFPRDPPEPRDAAESGRSKRHQTWESPLRSAGYKLLSHCELSSHLIPQVYVGLFGDEQGHDVGPPLLSSEVQRRDALQRLGVGRGPVLQQATGHLHLVLLGRNVQRGVTVLGRETGTAIWTVLTSKLRSKQDYYPEGQRTVSLTSCWASDLCAEAGLHVICTCKYRIFETTTQFYACFSHICWFLSLKGPMCNNDKRCPVGIKWNLKKKNKKNCQTVVMLPQTAAHDQEKHS